MDTQKNVFPKYTSGSQISARPWPGLGTDDLPSLDWPASEGGGPLPLPTPEVTPDEPASEGEGPLPLPTPEVTPDQGTTDNNTGHIPADSINPALLALAMGFVPRQSWESTYDYDVALKRGTIFPALDKPFLGKEGVSR